MGNVNNSCEGSLSNYNCSCNCKCEKTRTHTTLKTLKTHDLEDVNYNVIGGFKNILQKDEELNKVTHQENFSIFNAGGGEIDNSNNKNNKNYCDKENVMPLPMFKNTFRKMEHPSGVEEFNNFIKNNFEEDEVVVKSKNSNSPIPVKVGLNFAMDNQHEKENENEGKYTDEKTNDAANKTTKNFYNIENEENFEYSYTYADTSILHKSKSKNKNEKKQRLHEHSKYDKHDRNETNFTNVENTYTCNEDNYETNITDNVVLILTPLKIPNNNNTNKSKVLFTTANPNIQSITYKSNYPSNTTPNKQINKRLFFHKRFLSNLELINEQNNSNNSDKNNFLFKNFNKINSKMVKHNSRPQSWDKQSLKKSFNFNTNYTSNSITCSSLRKSKNSENNKINKNYINTKNSKFKNTDTYNIHISKIIQNYKLNHSNAFNIILNGELFKLSLDMNKSENLEVNSFAYSSKFCVLTKTEFKYYNSQESLLKLIKPNLTIPLNSIAEIILLNEDYLKDIHIRKINRDNQIYHLAIKIINSGKDDKEDNLKYLKTHRNEKYPPKNAPKKFSLNKKFNNLIIFGCFNLDHINIWVEVINFLYKK